MLPENGDDLQQGFAIVRQPSLTYRLDPKTGRVLGTVDGREAVKQAVYLALHTDRFAHEIFTPNYGNELNLLGGASPPLVYAKIRQAVQEAISVDDRITGVRDFTFSKERGTVLASFTVSTLYGDLEETAEVKMN